MSNLDKLPEKCYLVNQKNGTFQTDAPIIELRRGETGYFAIDSNLTHPAVIHGHVDRLNAAFGATKAHCEAMHAGSLFGWEAPAANPDLYNADGTFDRSHYPFERKLVYQIVISPQQRDMLVKALSLLAAVVEPSNGETDPTQFSLMLGDIDPTPSVNGLTL